MLKKIKKTNFKEDPNEFVLQRTEKVNLLQNNSTGTFDKVIAIDQLLSMYDSKHPVDITKIQQAYHRSLIIPKTRKHSNLQKVDVYDFEDDEQQMSRLHRMIEGIEHWNKEREMKQINKAKSRLRKCYTFRRSNRGKITQFKKSNDVKDSLFKQNVYPCIKVSFKKQIEDQQIKELLIEASSLEKKACEQFGLKFKDQKQQDAQNPFGSTKNILLDEPFQKEIANCAYKSQQPSLHIPTSSLGTKSVHHDKVPKFIMRKTIVRPPSRILTSISRARYMRVPI